MEIQDTLPKNPIKIDWQSNRIKSCQTVEMLQTIMQENQKLFKVNHLIQIFEKEQNFSKRSGVKLEDSEFSVSLYKSQLSKMNNMNLGQLKEFISTTIKINTKDENFKAIFVDNYVKLIDTAFKANPYAYVKHMSDFFKSNDKKSLIKKDDVSSISKLVSGLKVIDNFIENGKHFTKDETKIGNQLYYYSKLNCFLLDKNLCQINNVSNDILIKRFFENIDQLDYANLIFGLAGLCYQKSMVEVTQADPEDYLQDLNERILLVRQKIQDKQSDNDFEMDNWSSYSILLRVCRDLDFKDELLIQNLLIDLQKLAERETESERPNIDLHNINISLGCLADLQILDIKLMQSLKDLFINRIHLANAQKITDFIVNHATVSWTMFQGIKKTQEEQNEQIDDNSKENVDSQIKIYRGPGKTLNDFNIDFWMQIVTTLNVRFHEFDLEQMQKVFYCARRPALRLKSINRPQFEVFEKTLIKTRELAQSDPSSINKDTFLKQIYSSKLLFMKGKQKQKTDQISNDIIEILEHKTYIENPNSLKLKMIKSQPNDSKTKISHIEEEFF